MKSRVKRLLFVPCYNCEDQVVRIMDRLSLVKDNFFEILIVDNNSTDQTLSNLLKKNKFCKIMSHLENYGLGGSFKSAVDYAENIGCDYLYIIHGDDQADITDLINMLLFEEQEKPDCIFGARFMKDSKLENYSKIRILGNMIFNILFSLVFFRPVYDIGSGLNCYKLSSLPQKIDLWPAHIAFDVNLLIHYLSGNKKIKWMPIKWNEVDQVSTTKNINVGIKVLKILFGYLFTRKLSYVKNANKREFKIYE